MSIRNNILAYFESNRGVDVSGQELADHLGVSRNAVWKAVEGLRADDYLIDSGTNRGYRFSTANDILSEEGLRAALGKHMPHMRIIVFEEVDSTNNEAKRMLSSGFDGEALLVAKRQTAGRGRRGRSFESPAGGLYMTLVLQGGSIAVIPTLATMAAAVAVAHGLRGLCDAEPGIKWVNDVLVDGLKVCGILTEGISDLETGSMQSMVVGIGVNLGKRDFSSALDNIAGTVPLCEGRTRSEFAAQVVRELVEGISSEQAAMQMMQEYKRLSIVLGRTVNYELAGQMQSALAIDIAEDGGLMVQAEDGNRSVLMGGEISVRF